MNVKVTTTITDNRIPAIIAAFPGLMEQLVGKTAFDVQDTAQNLCPIDTGYLAGSITVTRNGLRAEVEPAAEYAGYVEFGTYKMAAQPYMRPAADMHEPEFVNAVDMIVRQMMG